jgi:imidazolonepropionase-like amidohydrolase
LHAHGTEGIPRTVMVDSIELGTFMNEEDMRLMKEHGTRYVLTIIAEDYVAQKAKVLGYYPPQVAPKAAASDRGARRIVILTAPKDLGDIRDLR